MIRHWTLRKRFRTISTLPFVPSLVWIARKILGTVLTPTFYKFWWTSGWLVKWWDLGPPWYLTKSVRSQNVFRYYILPRYKHLNWQASLQPQFRVCHISLYFSLTFCYMKYKHLWSGWDWNEMQNSWVGINTNRHVPSCWHDLTALLGILIQISHWNARVYSRCSLYSCLWLCWWKSNSLVFLMSRLLSPENGQGYDWRLYSMFKWSIRSLTLMIKSISLEILVSRLYSMRAVKEV